MSILAASDHHYYHRAIIKYTNRPFNYNDENCVIDNAKLMLERHNKIVQDDDLILLVGDLSAALNGRQKHFKELIKQMKGRKILVRGNHDHEPDHFYKDAGFIDVVTHFAVEQYFICHYPCYKTQYTNSKEQHYINLLKNSKCNSILHGHVHNKNPQDWAPDGYDRQNLSVDYAPNNYYPQLLDAPELVEYFKRYD